MGSNTGTRSVIGDLARLWLWRKLGRSEIDTVRLRLRLSRLPLVLKGCKSTTLLM